jgi:type II secretory pathway pseudopilin PulG
MRRLFIFKPNESQGGYILITALLTLVIMSFVIIIVAQGLINNTRFMTFEQKTTQALDIADAGINYYLWHLEHNPTDFKDGTGASGSGPYGPFVHNYYDANNKLLGTYTLTITAPPTGSTVATVKSVGKSTNNGDTRTVVAKVGQPSMAKYLFLSDVGMHFSSTATTNGTVLSNGCVDFDGTNNGPVQSAMSSCDGQNGVYGDGGPTSLWQYPVPSVDFNSVTANLAQMKTDAQNGGLYLSGSGGKGYYLVLNTNNTVNVYKVTSINTSNSAWTSVSKNFVATYTLPGNGIIFCNDDVWVSATGFNKHITIAAATLPESSSTYRHIYLDSNITYAAYDGSDTIGLVAQNDIWIPSYAPTTMQIDAALLSQYGSVGYDTDHGLAKNQFTLNGGITQRLNDYAFKVTGCGGVCRGFLTTIYNYDSNLLYGPPPDWPTTGIYSIITWREQ